MLAAIAAALSAAALVDYRGGEADGKPEPADPQIHHG